MVGVGGLSTGLYAYVRDRQTFTLAVALVGVCFIVMRCVSVKVFQHRDARNAIFDPDDWILGYGVTALASASCWGAISFSCLAFSHDPVLYLVAVSFNAATASALAARNAAAPRLARLQVLVSLLPIMAGGLFADEVGYRFLILAAPALIIALFVIIAEINQQAAELFAAQSKLVILSNTDDLTQIPNRRYFGNALSASLAADGQTFRPLAVLMIDVDFFKGYNDFYGHRAGDACLQQIARQLQSSLRHTDSVLSRYGGEEFAVLLRDTSAAGGAAIGRRLCDAVADLALPHPNRADGVGAVTISVGAAATSAADTGPFDIIESADYALYRAKTLGRNRVCMATAGGPQPTILSG
jgi:diguanylate cyclase (GGDEF)-like protein